MNKHKIEKTIAWGLVVLWMIIIFVFSNMNADESNIQSKSTISKAIDATVDTTNQLGITSNEISNESKYWLIELLNLPLRKCAHVSIYFILALLVMNALKTSYNNLKFSAIIVVFICFIYACTDEYHQLFISGRTGQFTDVLIDTFGAIVGIIIYNIMNNLIKKYKLIYNKNGTI